MLRFAPRNYRARALTLSALLGHAQGVALPPLSPVLAEPAALATTHYFSPTANWLVPGHVLLGRYPGSCPSRPIEGETQRARVEQIREKATTFVCLQDELPPQDALASWPPEGVGAQSGNAPEPQSAKFIPYYADAGGEEASFVHFGIVDRSVAASLEALDAAVLDLAKRVLGGERLYIHCWGGRGRTGLVAACLLGALYPELLDADEALARVQAYYQLREEGGKGTSPETEEQSQQVRDWFKYKASLGRGKAATAA